DTVAVEARDRAVHDPDVLVALAHLAVRAAGAVPDPRLLRRARPVEGMSVEIAGDVVRSDDEAVPGTREVICELDARLQYLAAAHRVAARTCLHGAGRRKSDERGDNRGWPEEPAHSGDEDYVLHGCSLRSVHDACGPRLDRSSRDQN